MFTEYLEEPINLYFHQLPQIKGWQTIAIGKSSPMSDFINKVLLEHSHTPICFNVVFGWFLLIMAKLSSCFKRPYSLRNLKYLLSGLLPFAYPCSR